MRRIREEKERGMIFTLDMIIALFFFMVIIYSMLWVWGESYQKMVEYRDQHERQERLQDISTILVKTPGNPSDWEYLGTITRADVKSIGLASSANVLDTDKLNTFMSADSQELREIMGLGSENFSLTISQDWSGTPRIIYYKGESTASRERMIIRRYAIYNNTRVEMKLEAYYNKR